MDIYTAIKAALEYLQESKVDEVEVRHEVEGMDTSENLMITLRRFRPMSELTRDSEGD